MPQTVHRQCTLCEAHCGIDVEVDGDRVLRITGDKEDPISRGYICPKAAALADLYEDPDLLRQPERAHDGGAVGTAAAPRARHAQPLLRDVGRPAAAAPDVGRDVREP